MYILSSRSQQKTCGSSSKRASQALCNTNNNKSYPLWKFYTEEWVAKQSLSPLAPQTLPPLLIAQILSNCMDHITDP